MKFTLDHTPLQDCFVITPQVFSDERGFFMESWNKREFEEAGITTEFVQENHSRSQKNVLRGLHYQRMPTPLAKLVRCIRGQILDVAVDLRTGSPTFGQWYSIELSEENKKQLLIPVGFAHGFFTLSEIAEVIYKQTDYYNPDAEVTLSWNDPTLAVSWPGEHPILSEKDQHGITFEQYQSNPDFR
jgi:dTDP-4-dehydrorhamnose 3,5-epimerase